MTKDLIHREIFLPFKPWPNILIFKLYSLTGGLGGRAIFLDADGSFCGERMNQIAEATKNTALKQMDSMGTKPR